MCLKQTLDISLAPYDRKLIKKKFVFFLLIFYILRLLGFDCWYFTEKMSNNESQIKLISVSPMWV